MSDIPEYEGGGAGAAVAPVLGVCVLVPDFGLGPDGAIILLGAFVVRFYLPTVNLGSFLRPEVTLLTPSASLMASLVLVSESWGPLESSLVLLKDMSCVLFSCWLRPGSVLDRPPLSGILPVLH
jgi:hypothetical protein